MKKKLKQTKMPYFSTTCVKIFKRTKKICFGTYMDKYKYYKYLLGGVLFFKF